jgi:hypothetical protein
MSALMEALQAGHEAKHKQRWARSAELYARAATLASASAPPDSLVLVDLRLRRALTQMDQARASGAADAAPLCADAAAAAAAAAVTLTARADAGTLLPGALREDELAYTRGAVRVELLVENAHRTDDARYVALLQADAPLLGYECALRTALLLLGRLLPGQTPLPALPAADAAAAHAFVLRALALMREVSHSHTRALVLGAEVRLAHLMTQLCSPERAASMRGPDALLDAAFFDQLCASWARHDTQAALTAHGTLGALGRGALEADKRACAARRDADAAAAGLRECALPACGAQEASVRQFKICGGCKQLAYCCAEHALAHWKSGHKQACRRSVQ